MPGSRRPQQNIVLSTKIYNLMCSGSQSICAEMKTRTSREGAKFLIMASRGEAVGVCLRDGDRSGGFAIGVARWN